MKIKILVLHFVLYNYALLWKEEQNILLWRFLQSNNLMNKIIKNSSFQLNSDGDEIDIISSSHNCFCVGTEAASGNFYVQQNYETNDFLLSGSSMISGAIIPHHNLSYLK